MNTSTTQPAPHPYMRPPGPAGPQSQIQCNGCRIVLMYPQGAQNVRCARCGHITSATPPVDANMAQLVCTNSQCRVVLMYPRGASQVQCSCCGSLNCAQAANQVGHVVCSCCQITLMYAHGASSVKCAVCNHVTPVNPGSSLGSGPAQKLEQTVLVENPSSVDEHGNEVTNVAIGVKKGL